MKKEDFDKLSVEHKLTIIETHQNLLTSSIYSRMGLLPLMAGLAATLLVIATFNDKLIPLDNTIRFLTSVLLIIIPFSLYLYNDDLKTSQKKNKSYIDNLLGTENKKMENTFIGKLTCYTPDAVIYILAIVVLIIIKKIWCF